ncbi:hypothetical protein [Mucisphaera sp.]|uniref:hypothetical protein n=1 Tax=Mucisphaera sp. TaxID=2913024 RepID=UPI003D0C4A8E
MKATITPAILLSALATPAFAITIASQDFEGNTLADIITQDTDLGTAAGTFFDSSSGLGWSVSITNNANGSNGPISGTENGDLIGVVNNSVTSSNDLTDAGNTTNWFHADDVDGLLLLTFDPIDATNYTDLTLTFDWAANDATGFELADTFAVQVNGIEQFSVSGDDLESTISDTKAFTDNFAPVSLDLSAFNQSEINIVVSFSNNAGDEDLAFDNLQLTGNLIPTPAAFTAGLLGLGTLLLRRSH